MQIKASMPLLSTMTARLRSPVTRFSCEVNAVLRRREARTTAEQIVRMRARGGVCSPPCSSACRTVCRTACRLASAVAGRVRTARVAVRRIDCWRGGNGRKTRSKKREDVWRRRAVCNSPWSWVVSRRASAASWGSLRCATGTTSTRLPQPFLPVARRLCGVPWRAKGIVAGCVYAQGIARAATTRNHARSVRCVRRRKAGHAIGRFRAGVGRVCVCARLVARLRTDEDWTGGEDARLRADGGGSGRW